jgi:hypothetical protein
VRNVILTRVLPTALAAALLVAAAGLTMVKRPLRLTAGTSAPLPASVPAGVATRACPAPGLAGSAAAKVALIAVHGATAAPAVAGKAVITGFGGAAAPVATITQPGSLALASVKPQPGTGASAKPPAGQAVSTLPAPGGVIIQATGPMASGLEAEQVSASGTAVTRCDGPGTDFWFVGPGRFTVAHVQLYLMNPGDQPADVSVEAFTDAGPLQGSADTGVAVAPHAMLTQSLDTMLRGSRAVALHVRTSVGQVTAALHEGSGPAGRGTWLPSAQPPASQVLLPVLPATAGARQLFLAVPGSADAHVTLTSITDHGSYEPTGGGGLDIPGGSVASVSLPSLAGVPGALKVAANVPVTASVMLPGGRRGAPGVFTAAYPPIRAQGVVAASQSGAGETAELVLSAPARAASARVTELATAAAGKAAAAGPGKVVRVAARHSVVVQLAQPAGAARGSQFAVVVTPLAGSGPLYAGRVLAGSGKGGTLQSILPVPAAPTTVRLPVVRNASITSAG